jgi:L-asparaginase
MGAAFSYASIPGRQSVRIKIYTTGGSLDKGYSTKESAFVVQDPQAAPLLHDANVNFEFEIESLFKKDSLELTEEDRDLIVQRVSGDPCQRILITHGTDTMALTGQRFASVEGKTIVLTGAMQPGAFKHSDAPFNLGFALGCLQTLPFGVYLAMNGRVFDPHRVTKNLELDRFEKPPRGEE